MSNFYHLTLWAHRVGCQTNFAILIPYTYSKRKQYGLQDKWLQTNTVWISLVSRSTHLTDDWFKLIAICTETLFFLHLQVSCSFSLVQHYISCIVVVDLLKTEMILMSAHFVYGCAQINFPTVTELICSTRLTWKDIRNEAILLHINFRLPSLSMWNFTRFLCACWTVWP